MKIINRVIFSSSLTLLSFIATASDEGLSQLALQQAHFPIEKAVEEVKNNYPGLITEVKFDDYNYQSVFEVDVINQEKNVKHELKFSTADGLLLKEEKTRLSTAGYSHIDDKFLAKLTQLEKSNIDLLASINTIQGEYRSKIVEIELENKKGMTFYEVELSNGSELILDIVTGKIIPIKNEYYN